MQKLANVILRQNQFGSTVQIKNVTPAQLLVLTSMFHKAVGGDPFETRGKVQGVVEIPDDRESKLIEEQQKIVDENQALLDALGEDEELTKEIKDKRETAYLNRINLAQDRIRDLQSVEYIRKLTPDMEKNRLLGLYGKKYVEPLFPSAMPTLPETFQQAREIGLRLENEPGGLDSHLFLTEGKAAA